MSDDPELSAVEECEAQLTIGDVTAFCTKLKGHDRSHSDDEGHSWVILADLGEMVAALEDHGGQMFIPDPERAILWEVTHLGTWEASPTAASSCDSLAPSPTSSLPAPSSPSTPPCTGRTSGGQNRGHRSEGG